MAALVLTLLVIVTVGIGTPILIGRHVRRKYDQPVLFSWRSIPSALGAILFVFGGLYMQSSPSLRHEVENETNASQTEDQVAPVNERATAQDPTAMLPTSDSTGAEKPGSAEGSQTDLAGSEQAAESAPSVSQSMDGVVRQEGASDSSQPASNTSIQDEQARAEEERRAEEENRRKRQDAIRLIESLANRALNQ